MEPKLVARKLFQACKADIPSSERLSMMAIEQSKYSKMRPEEIKLQFSEAVLSLQLSAYELYLEHEKLAARKAILNEFSPQFDETAKPVEVVSFFANNFELFDKFSLSLTQSRRSRAGVAFEVIVSNLFDRLSYPFTAQPDIGGSTPDYVLPSDDWYYKYPADSIIFTLKRTLRERWRQIITESSSGKYYLATIDDQVSQSALRQMMERNVTLVVPTSIKSENYSDSLNVIDFEGFFEDHLDPSIVRWQKNNAITREI